MSAPRCGSTPYASSMLQPGPSFLRHRELAGSQKSRRPFYADRCGTYNSSIVPVAQWNASAAPQGFCTGGIFALEYTPEGDALMAACEHRCLVMCDPLRVKQPIRCFPGVHSHCVNAVRFLDSRIFATCSDDHTVKLWDLRYLKPTSPVKTLRGHSHWVKNVEFVQRNNTPTLVSSGFDSFVLAWDVNGAACEPRRLFHTSGLMRMRLADNAEKMLISTHFGYIFAVHDLDLDTFHKDMFYQNIHFYVLPWVNKPTYVAVIYNIEGFKPNVFWIALQTHTILYPHTSGTQSSTVSSTRKDQLKRFTAKRNRAELILDFPTGCEPDNISSIAPHPKGWCVASRLSHADERSEWTCLHDIQSVPNKSYSSDFMQNSDSMKESSGEMQLANLLDFANDGTPFDDDMSGGRSLRRRPLVGGHDEQETPAARRRRLDVEMQADQSNSNSPSGTNQSATGSAAPSQPSADAPERFMLVRPRDRRLVLARSVNRDRRFFRTHMLAADVWDTPEIDGAGAARALPLDSDSASSSQAPISVSGASGVPQIVVTPPAHQQNDRTFAQAARRLAQATSVQVQSRALNMNLQTALQIQMGDSGFQWRQRSFAGSEASGKDYLSRGMPPRQRRLLAYKTEPRVGRGYIKEINWSPDGRCLASPFAYGVRLLALDSAGSELCDLDHGRSLGKRAAIELTELGLSLAHTEVVLTTRFSPVHAATLATGCLAGVVALHQPRG